MTPEGVKTLEKDEINSKQFDEKHIEIGVDSLRKLMDNVYPMLLDENDKVSQKRIKEVKNHIDKYKSLDKISN